MLTVLSYKKLNIPHILINSVKLKKGDDVNTKILDVTTKYFLILDDTIEIADNYFDTILTYLQEMEADVFTNIVKVEQEQNHFLQNEHLWVLAESQEKGWLDYENAKKTFVNLDCVVYKTDVFLERGGLKTNIEYFAKEELLLRILYGGSKLFCIPKILYKSIQPKETNFDKVEKQKWKNVAMKEHFFKIQRDINFE